MLDTAQECHKLDVAIVAVSTVGHDIVLSANVHNWPSIVIGKGRVRLLVQMYNVACRLHACALDL